MGRERQRRRCCGARSRDGALLFLARPVPLPARVLTGLVDVIAGAVLLVVWNQKFRERGTPPAARVSGEPPAPR